MVVYADVLIGLNTIVTYFILLAAKRISGVMVKHYRIILSSVVGGFLALYIFLPQQHFLVEVGVKLLFSAVITIIAFGSRPFKSYLRALFCFYAVSFLYAGFMLGFWYVLKPDGMAINNGVVYFSISPVVLILSTVICYFGIRGVQIFLRREDTYSVNKSIRLNFENKSVVCRCLVDTGSTINDPVGGCKVIILSKKTAEQLFGEKTVTSALKMKVDSGIATKFRVIPYKTLNSTGLMPSIRIDSAQSDSIKIDKVIAGISDASFDGDFGGIISPNFIE